MTEQRSLPLHVHLDGDLRVAATDLAAVLDLEPKAFDQLAVEFVQVATSTQRTALVRGSSGYMLGNQTLRFALTTLARENRLPGGTLALMLDLDVLAAIARNARRAISGETVESTASILELGIQLATDGKASFEAVAREALAHLRG